MRIPRIALAVLLATSLQPAAAAAQTLRGRLLDHETGTPVATAFVRLRDGAGADVAAMLSDSAGGFLMRAPGPGRFTLHIERLGYRTFVSDTFALVPGPALLRDFRIPVTAVRLAPIRISAATRCTARRELRGEAAAIWEEVRKALSVAQWTQQSGTIRYEVLEWERRLHARSLDVVGERRGVAVLEDERSPFRASLPARELVAGGFIREEDGYWVYDGPDADVLLSDDFLDAHCFRPVMDRRQPRLVGLAFEPSSGDRPGIRGTLWLDGETFELRFVEFTYVHLPWRVNAPAAGGRVEFRRLREGGWIVDRWWLRSPNLTRSVTDRRLRLGGYTEIGREVRTITRVEGGS